MLLAFGLTIVIVGFVTAGLSIKFDRFFAILLLLFFFKYTIFEAVNVYLWIIMAGALTILLSNREKLRVLPKKMKIKLFVGIPLFTLVASFFGSLLFVTGNRTLLMVILGTLAALYGLRLIFIHFKPQEMDLQNPKPAVTRFCGFFGPLLSGFSIGLIGTSLKPLKIPFAVRAGKMNMKQVYLGNSTTAFFAALFAIMWHAVLGENSVSGNFYEQLLLGASLWAGIHFVSELTTLFFRNGWRKVFQIVIGIVLLVIAVKVFKLI
jgi:uncharacterized membrane protein YfcA